MCKQSIAAVVILGVMGAGASAQMSKKRPVMDAEVAISTQPAAKVSEQIAAKVLDHDSEISRGESVTAIIRINNCEPDAKGACNTSADLVVYRPDGSVLSQVKKIELPAGRGTVALKFAPSEITGVYKIVATVRDLNARRFGTTERLFGVK